MKEKNVSKWTVMSSVVPKTKTRETKKHRKNSQQQQSSKSVKQQKTTSRVTACAPTPKIDRTRLEENLTPEITFRQTGRFLVQGNFWRYSVLCFWGLPNSTGQQLTTPETSGSRGAKGPMGHPCYSGGPIPGREAPRGPEGPPRLPNRPETAETRKNTFIYQEPPEPLSHCLASKTNTIHGPDSALAHTVAKKQ